MKGSHILHAETVTASGAVTGWRFVTHAGAQASVQGEKVLGPAAYDADAGADLAVNAIGLVVVEAGGAIAVGDDVITDPQGKAITNPAAGAEYVAGVARSAGQAGGTVAILLK